MSTPKQSAPQASPLPEFFGWLADAPLFIDGELVASFYDAVVRPEGRHVGTKLELTESQLKQWSMKAGGEAKVSPGSLLGLFGSLFPGLEIKGEGEAGRGGQESTQTGRTLELHAIDNPQRQLIQLAIHYFLNHPDRLFAPACASQPEWRDPTAIARLPRALLFLDLPGQAEAEDKGLVLTRLIPTAAEFVTGRVHLIYEGLTKETEAKRHTVEHPPKYPEPKKGKTAEQLRAERADYWKWFADNFSATQAMLAVEEAAGQQGRFSWIDYRLPLTKEGDTLHLHFCPRGKYDTGVLAYNLVKRGFKHGLRIVGTLKSEPDLNVLAVYEK